MYQNFSSNEDEAKDLFEVALDNDKEYMDLGFEPIGCLLRDGDYLITDFLGEFSDGGNPFHSGLYLIGNKLSYFDGDNWIVPSKIVYA